MRGMPCCGCGLRLPDIEGPTHPYVLSSPACWKVYGEVLAKEYSDRKYWSVHRLTVDAYAIQHPGTIDRRAVQSVSAHLLCLYLIFEQDMFFSDATKAIAQLVKKMKGQFRYLERPANVGELTVLDVWQAKSAEEHIAIVRSWAESAFKLWFEQYESYIRDLAKHITKTH